MQRQVELYIREGDENTGEYIRVDLFDFEDINYTSRVKDIRDIKKVVTDFSHSFTIPASKRNNNLFKHYDKWDILDGFDARYKRDALIKINGIDYREGMISLSKASTKKGQLYSYTCTFYGKIVSLKQLFGSDYIHNLYGGSTETYLDGFNHNLTSLYIADGFTDGYNFDDSTSTLSRNYSAIHCGDYCFPFISYDSYHYYDTGDGLSPKDGANHSRNIHPSATYNSSIDQYTGVKAFDLKPAIKIKWIVKSIEQKYGITFSDEFFSDSNAEYEKLFMNCCRERESIEEQTGTSETEFGLDNFTYTSTGSTIGDVIVNGNQLRPTGSSADDIRYVLSWTITPDNNSGLYDMKIRNSIDNAVLHQANNLSGVGSQSLTLEYDEYIEPEIQITTEGGITSATISDLTIHREIYEYQGNSGGGALWSWEPDGVAEYTVDTASVTFSGGINIGNQLPKMKVIDFLSTLFKMFNLTAYFDGTTINVETMDEFYNKGRYYDISEFVNADKTDVSKGTLYNKIDFIYKGDKTFAKSKSDDITGDDFGDERVDHKSNALSSPLAFDGNEDYKVELPLEKMMFERMTDQDDEDVITDVQWGWMANEDASGIKGKPLFFYPYKTPTSSTEIRFSMTDGGSSVTMDSYIVPTNILDVDDADSQTLHWGSEYNEWNGEQIDTSLFMTYYKNYISNIYDKRSRIIKVQAIFPTNLILQITPNDKMVINNRSYFMNKMETNLTTGKTKLELISEVDKLQNLEIGKTFNGMNNTQGGGDTTGPTMTITSSTVNDGDSSTDANISLTFTSNESTTDFASGDVTVTNGTLAGFSGSGTTYTAVFTPTTDGACTIDVASATFTDAAGNDNSAASQFNWTKTSASGSGPTVAITASGGLTNGGSTSSTTHTFTFTLSEASTDFDDTDVTHTGTLLANWTGLSSTVYRCEIGTLMGGTYTITVGAGTFTNSGGDSNQASSFTFTRT